MKIASISKFNISDGKGIRVSIYTSGCPFHCLGCHNQELWDYDKGNDYNEVIEDILNCCDKDYISGLSILGGEPLIKQNLDGLINLIDRFNERFPDKDIWLWTGHKMTDLFSYSYVTMHELNERKLQYILSKCKYVVDGKFEADKRDITLAFRGSTNQRIYENKNMTFYDVTDKLDEN